MVTCVISNSIRPCVGSWLLLRTFATPSANLRHKAFFQGGLEANGFCRSRREGRGVGRKILSGPLFEFVGPRRIRKMLENIRHIIARLKERKPGAQRVEIFARKIPGEVDVFTCSSDACNQMRSV